MSIVAGIDVGSLSGEAVILDDYRLISWSIVRVTPDVVKTASDALDRALADARLTIEDIEYIVSTGYGRLGIPYARGHVTDIASHARGLHWLKPDVRTILDLGGQDCKVIRCDENGNVLNFAMNDKCAAGTGRYLERVARSLGVPLEQIGPMSLETVNGPEKISSYCTVFAERDIGNLLVQGKHPNDVLAGAFRALSRRVVQMVRQVGIEEAFYVSGGVAKNIGVLKCLEEELGIKIGRVDEPQIVGALGAALFAAGVIREKGQIK